ncbi:MAG: hypothetical protein COA82_13185 [Alkaliphilus sp.]|nr:MAG: hypothetical protein COA82_13185 [Alkaliphilus sp.]
MEVKIVKPKRSYRGVKWKTNVANKKRLVKDFNNRCAYCDDLDKHGGGYRNYHVEHFAPKDKFHELEYNYSNLLYSCQYCNISKSNKWIGSTANTSVIGDKGFLDPCGEQYYQHLKRNESGKIVPITKLGRYMYNELQLYLLRHELIYSIDKISLKIKMIKQIIEMKKQKGENTGPLEAFKSELSDAFFNYYDLLTDENR